MAYSIRFEGVGSDGKTLFTIEPHWWQVEVVRERFEKRWIVTNETGSYTDEDVDISASEARALHRHFRKELKKMITYNESCLKSYRKDTDEYAPLRVADYTKYCDELKGHLELLDGAVGEDAATFAHFHVCIFEWDSGL
jgi:hypothetical protein